MAHFRICGLVYIDATDPRHTHWAPSVRYLRPISISAHTSIISSVSRTKLRQTFAGPPKSVGTLKEVRYQFPLYDGVSVVGFTCTIGSRVIKGVVKEKARAREVFDEAVAKGERAGLLEQLPEAADVFTTTLGNIPPDVRIEVEIEFLGELKHDASVDGVRLTIPTAIAPRYGSYPGGLVGSSQLAPSSTIPSRTKGEQENESGIHITVDAQLPPNAQITSIQSPSHQIAVSVGKTSTCPLNSQLSFNKASATLTSGFCELDKDFILQIISPSFSQPVVVLEHHRNPSFPHQRALMATLVPKFNLPASKPEIVFVCDRSGSMSSNIPNLQTALRIFIKSLPLGTKFNICSFGSRYSFLWDRSKTYDANSVKEAMKHVDGFSANYGGTEMYQPMEACFEKRYKDMDLEVFLLTDGETWDQERLIKMVGDKVRESEGRTRVFTLGIGMGASSSLCEGVARAGNGFSQSVVDGEGMSGMVVRMLKGALFPHIKDYSLEVKYAKDEVEGEMQVDDEDDGFEVVEKVMNGLVIQDEDVSAPPYSEKPQDSLSETSPAPAKISLFDESIDQSLPSPGALPAKKAADKYSHLPPCPAPAYLQTPFEIPSLFPFNRTTVYLLLNSPAPTSSRTNQPLTPKFVILRGTSAYGPLELEIPITVAPTPGETIHQLAAKKAVQELEEGRGWLQYAKHVDGSLLRDKYDGQFSDMVEREAVRLGVKYQVGGKWCSFVAVEANSDPSSESEGIVAAEAARYESYDPTISHEGSISAVYSIQANMTNTKSAKRGGGMMSRLGSAVASVGGLRSSRSPLLGGSSRPAGPAAPPPPPAPMSSFGGVRRNHDSEVAARYSPASYGGGPPGGLSSRSMRPSGPPMPPAAAPSSAARFGAAALSVSAQRCRKASSSAFVDVEAEVEDEEAGEEDLIDYSDEEVVAPSRDRLKESKESSQSSSSKMSSMFSPKKKKKMAPGGDSSEDKSEAIGSSRSRSRRTSSGDGGHQQAASLPADPMEALIVLQQFEGSWLWEDVLGVMKWNELTVLKGLSETKGSAVLATALVAAWFRNEKVAVKDSWELVVDKAVDWLNAQGGNGEELVTKAAKVLESL